MKQNWIKYKITMWYTAILIAVILVLVIGILYVTEYYITKEARLELEDEVSDFYKELNKIQDTSSELLKLRYYDDGVVLSIYDNQKRMLDGFYPDEFSLSTSFEDEKVREIRNEDGYWMVLDRRIEVDGKDYWIRGIYTLNLLQGMSRKLFGYMALIVPFMLLFTGFVGYRMIRKALHPIYDLTKMAKDITSSSDLSLRLPDPRTADEIGHLTETFNYMLQHLENLFKRETQFTADAAHELRTPISVIISRCEYCLEDLKLNGEVREELEIICKKARGMSELVSQLLMIARAENGTYQPDYEKTDLILLVDTILSELREKAQGKNITLKRSSKVSGLKITCDFNLIMQMLVNLIDNAINYGREGGNVEVILEEEEQQISIRVKDDGIGIPQEEQSKIWNRFYRVDASHSGQNGSGLGLFMVKWIVELHKGTIELKSMPELGSIFSVVLPKDVSEKK